MKTPPLSAGGHTALLALPISAVLATKNPDGTLRMTPLVDKARACADVLSSYGNRVYLSFRPNREVNWDFRMG